MPRRLEEFILALSVGRCFRACRKAIAELNWEILDDTETEGRSVCKEANYADLIRGTWPVQIEILLHAESSDPSYAKVIMNGSNRGLGPIQSRHLEGQMGNLQNRLRLVVNEATVAAPQPSESLTTELERLAGLHDQGILTDKEFRLAKEKLLNQ